MFLGLVLPRRRFNCKKFYRFGSGDELSRVYLFSCPGVLNRRDGGPTVLRASLADHGDSGGWGLTVAGGFFSCLQGADELVVTRLH